MIELNRGFFDEMVEHGLAVFPNEACGLLAGKEDQPIRFFPMKNADASSDSFSLDPGEHLDVSREIDQEGWELLAIFHTHTHSGSYMSETDLKHAPTWYYPEARYLVMSLADRSNPLLKVFRVEDGLATEEELVIA
jgi:proteasome lid subunit RPN8/RPN11